MDLRPPANKQKFTELKKTTVFYFQKSEISGRKRNNTKVTNYCRSKSQMIRNSIGLILKDVLPVSLFKTRSDLRKTEGKETETALISNICVFLRSLLFKY